MATNTKKKFSGRQEELPAVAGFLSTSFNRDLPLFNDYSSEFDAAYATNFGNQLTTVNGVVYPKALTQQGKLVTARIAATLKHLKAPNKLTESYANRAGDALTVLPVDFGCRALRKKMRKGDVEGVIAALRALVQNIDANLAALTAKGFKGSIRAEMVAATDSLVADNTLQNNNIETRNQLVNDNIALFDALYATMREVAEAGKVIHATTSGTPERIPDYTMTLLLKRVRNERKKE